MDDRLPELRELRADVGVRRRCGGNGQQPGGGHDGQGRQNKTEQRPCVTPRKHWLGHLLPCGFQRLGSQPEMDQAPYCLGPCWQIGLLATPSVDGAEF